MPITLFDSALKELRLNNTNLTLLQCLRENAAQITDPAQLTQLDQILNQPSPAAGLPTGPTTITIAPRSRLRRAAPWAAGVLLAAGIGVGVYNLWNNGYLSGIPGVT